MPYNLSTVNSNPKHSLLYKHEIAIYVIKMKKFAINKTITNNGTSVIYLHFFTDWSVFVFWIIYFCMTLGCWDQSFRPWSETNNQSKTKLMQKLKWCLVLVIDQSLRPNFMPRPKSETIVWSETEHNLRSLVLDQSFAMHLDRQTALPVSSNPYYQNFSLKGTLRCRLTYIFFSFNKKFNI